MKSKVTLCGLLFISLFISPLFAYWDKRPQFQWLQTYTYELHHDNHELYTNRLSLTFNYLDAKENPLVKITPFFEIRRNIDKNLWQRKELGLEIGKDIFPWAYLGEAIQHGWMKEDYKDYRDYVKRDYTESETRLIFSHYLLQKENFKLKGFIINEFTFNLDDLEGVRNEAVLGLIIPIGKYIETIINWRHIDRIHDYDSDVVEGSLAFIF